MTIFQTYSGKDPKTEAIKAKNFVYRQHTPPIITTTAATPQDSPNTTLEAGTSFKHWDSLDLQALEQVKFIKTKEIQLSINFYQQQQKISRKVYHHC